MSAIYKREIKAYLWSVTGWLFMAALICLSGFYFFVINLNYGYGNLSASVASLFFILLLTTPILAMRILAEEKKQKTDQLILTAPVSVGGIVVGKFMAMATIFAVPVAVLCVLPLILKKYGTVPMGESYTAILTYFLFGLVCIAVSLFISSLTESQVIAAVLSFAVLFVGYMMDGIISFVFTSENLITKVLNAFSFYPRLESLMGGTLNLSAVLYFVTLICVFLYLTTQSIQKRRYQVSVKTLQMGAYSTAATAVVIAIAVFANMAVGLLPASYINLDISSQKLYSLTETTKNVVKNLEEDVTVYVITSEESQDEILARTLERYQELSDRIHVVYKDPVVYPAFYQQYTNNITMNSMIVESDRRFKVVYYSDIFQTTVDYTTYTSNVTGYDAEGLLTSAIAYVTSDNAPKVYEVNGHGEATLSTTFTDGIAKENADLGALTLLQSQEVPEDADAVILNAPATDINAEDADKLIAYLEQGGKIILATYLTDVFTENMPNLSRVLEYFGLAIGDGIIMEGDQNRIYQSPIYILPEVQISAMTSTVYDNSYDVVMFPYAQAIHVNETEGVEVTTLLNTSDSAYEKMGLAENSTTEKTANDPSGTFVVGAHAVKTIDEEKTAEIVVYTSAFVFSDSANQYTMNNNLKLLTNAVGEFAGEGESVSVPVKSYEEDYVTVPFGTALLLGGLITILIPVALLSSGVVIWYKRRKR